MKILFSHRLGDVLVDDDVYEEIKDGCFVLASNKKLNYPSICVYKDGTVHKKRFVMENPNKPCRNCGKMTYRSKLCRSCDYERKKQPGYKKIKPQKKYWMVLSRFIMKAKSNEYVDHVDRNPLNNQRNNLRICTNQQNQWNISKKSHNKTGYKGVVKLKTCNRYVAQIGYNYKTIYLGTYKTAEEASKAYLTKLKELAGDFYSS